MSIKLDKSVVYGKPLLVNEPVYGLSLEKTAKRLGNRRAFAFRTCDGSVHEEYNFDQLYDYSNRVGCGLHKVLGMKRGDKCGIYLPNCSEYIILQTAIESSGFVLAQINPTHTQEQLARITPRFGIQMIATTKELAKRIRLFDRSIKLLLVDVNQEDIQSLTEEFGEIYSYSHLLSIEPDMEFIHTVRQEIKPSDDLYYGCTSGSTGEPKICVYDNYGFTNNIFNIKSTVTYDDKIRISFVPFFTNFGNIVQSTCVLYGVFTVFLDHFDPVTIFKTIEEYKGTKLDGAPSAFLALMQNKAFKEYNMSSLKEITIGGAASNDEFLERVAKEFHVKYVYSGYGMTELCGLMYRIPNKSSGLHAQLIPGYSLRIVDDNRNVVDCGVDGEIEVKSNLMMTHYLGYTRDEWFATGDIGRLEHDGYLSITGRKKEMMIRGSINVWPAEIYEGIKDVDEIKESVAFGIPDVKRKSEFIILDITVKDSVKDKEEFQRHIRSLLKSRIRPIAVPDFVFIIDSMPKTAVGKIHTPTLKEAAIKKIEEYHKQLEENNSDAVTSELGIAIAKIWEEYLNIPIKAISRETQFKDIGGDSFVSSLTIEEITKQTGKQVPYDELSYLGTIKQIEEKYNKW